MKWFTFLLAKLYAWLLPRQGSTFAAIFAVAFLLTLPIAAVLVPLMVAACPLPCPHEGWVKLGGGTVHIGLIALVSFWYVPRAEQLLVQHRQSPLFNSPGGNAIVGIVLVVEFVICVVVLRPG
jgi:hypothetical protein